MKAYDYNESPFDHYDEYPEDSPFPPTEKQELEYRDEVAERVISAMQEYLSFATVRDLIKLLGLNL